MVVGRVWNVMAHAQKPDFVFRRKGRVHLNRRGCQFSRLLAGELCTSACRVCPARASLCSAVMWRLLVTPPFSCFPFTSPPVRHRVPSHCNWTLRFKMVIIHSLFLPQKALSIHNSSSVWSERKAKRHWPSRPDKRVIVTAVTYIADTLCWRLCQQQRLHSPRLILYTYGWWRLILKASISQDIQAI